MQSPPKMDDPRYAAMAWARFRRILGWMTLVAVGVAAVSLYWLNRDGQGLTLVEFIIIGLGIILTIMLTAALMGLVFLSSGTGHDEQIDDPFKDIADD